MDGTICNVMHASSERVQSRGPKTGGAEAVTSASPAAFAQYVAAETERWARIAKDANATPD